MKLTKHPSGLILTERLCQRGKKQMNKYIGHTFHRPLTETPTVCDTYPSVDDCWSECCLLRRLLKLNGGNIEGPIYDGETHSSPHTLARVYLGGLHGGIICLYGGFIWGVYMGPFRGFIWGPFGSERAPNPSPSCTDVVPSVCENKEARPAPFPWG